MKLKEFFSRFRTEVDDLKDPYLWTDSDLESYLNWSLEELAKKTMYFLDQTTWGALDITAADPKIAATTANYLSKILFIRRATLGSTGRKLSILTMGQADTKPQEDDYGRYLFDVSSAWESQSGAPMILVTDYYEDGSLRLGPIPSDTDTLALWAYRLPLRYVSFEVCNSLDLAEAIGVEQYSHQLVVLQGMKAQAYLKEDPETRDDQMAAQSLALFERKLEEVRLELKRKRHPVGKIRYGGI